MSNRSSVRVGIVGAGLSAETLHLPVFKRLKEVEVMAVCDINQSKAQRLAKLFDIPNVYSELEEMLEKEALDVLDICTPPQSHFEVAIKSLERKIPCIIEKPFTITTAEADNIIKMSQVKNVPIFPIFDHPYFPGIRKAKRLVGKGLIGDLLCVHISYCEPCPLRYLSPDHWSHNLSGGYFGDAEPHLAMLLVEFLSSVKEVKAVASKKSVHLTLPIDELCITATFENNSIGSIIHSVGCPSFFMRVDIIGSKGILSVDGIFNSIVHYGEKAKLGNPWILGLTFAKGILSQTVSLATTATNTIINRYLLKSEPNTHSYLLSKAINALLGRDIYPVEVSRARECVRFLELAFSSLIIKNMLEGKK